ncbi:hypothetical protein J7L27_02690 [Candidatus Bathyarchaeota archaeon]|nr:hypothetical protein [Candidatus Bathyarchaeota archaeon]
MQRRLIEYQQPSRKEEETPTWSFSVREISNEVNNQLKVFQSYIKEIKEASIRLEELTKMLKSGEISENVYNILLDEISNNLSLSIEEVFKIRENLELLRARAKIEWAREKIGIKEETRTQDYSSIYGRSSVEETYSPAYRWQEIINKIDSALSSLTFEEEISMIERYLSIMRKKGSPSISENIEKAKQICQQRLNVLTEEWSLIRRDKIKEMMDLETKASQLRDEIKEIEVRLAVGEIDRRTFEYRIRSLRGSLRRLEEEISKIRGYIDDMDMKIFRSSELLREMQ